MGHIIIGIVMIVSGGLITLNAYKLLNNFGPIGFFERHGGSLFGYKITGIIISLIGLLVMTNLIYGFLAWLLGPLLKYQ